MTQTNTDKTVSNERLADARVRFIGAKSRVDDEEMVEVPADYLDEGIAAFTELLASRTQEPAERLEKTLTDHAAKHGPLFIEDIEDIFSTLRAASITPPAPERSKEDAVGWLVEFSSGFKHLIAGREQPTHFTLPEGDRIVTLVPVYTSPAPLPVGEEEALLALIREEAGKDNSPLGRSDSLAIRRIRTALGLDPHSGAALSKPGEQG